MADEARAPITEEMRFQRRTWRVQRAGWVVLALLVIAALLGVFGSGPLSVVVAKSENGVVEVAYQRFARRTARSHFTIHVAGPLAGDVEVRLSASFGETYDIESLYPQPRHNGAGAAALEFDFAPSSAGDLLIEIAVRPRRFGLLEANLEVSDHGRIGIVQLIYP